MAEATLPRGTPPSRSHQAVRCAIYTRKSTEEGLEQVFNSLDAQREACAAYIASQKHEGWLLSPELYDDGGFSGGNMNRPGLAALMAEVEAGRIQVIVVYKVDRLTRSLADFAKIVEVLDARGASFVSITQSFNTTTSMGRLTLNVLLSFAQFEREITGERICDKIAASKAKGMWMGGPVPLGYDVRDRKLVVNEAEAKTVRAIYGRYLQLGSVRATLEALGRDGIRTKDTRRADGGGRGGQAWTRGALGHLLANRVYIGEVCHHGAHYPGEHAAIVLLELWAGVQEQFASQCHERHAVTNQRHANRLGGLLFDGLGRRMKPTHTNKGSKRYHYYVTCPDAIRATPCPIWRVPAHDVEVLVFQRLRALLADRIALHDAVGNDAITSADLVALFAMADRIHAATTEHATAALELVRRIDLHDDRVAISVGLDALLPATEGVAPTRQIELLVPVSRLRSIRDTRNVITDHGIDPPADPALLKLLGSAHAADHAMRASSASPLAEVAARHGYTPAYFTTMLRLATLAPDIVEAIVAGRQPASLTRQRLANVTSLPLDWSAQRAALGFAAAA